MNEKEKPSFPDGASAEEREASGVNEIKKPSFPDGASAEERGASEVNEIKKPSFPNGFSAERHGKTSVREFGLLLSVILKNRRRSGGKGLRGKDGSLKKGMPALIVFLSLCCAAAFFGIGASLGETASLMNAGAEIMALTIVGVQCITFVYGTAAVFSVMYMSDDNEFLLSLPVSPQNVYLAKLSIVYAEELSLAALILVPLLTAFGLTYGGASAGYYTEFFLMMPLIVLTAPLFPLLIISVFSVPFMYVAAFFKKRASLSGLASVAGMAVVMAVYFFFISNISGTLGGTADIADGGEAAFSESTLSALRIMSYIAYPLRAAAKAALAENTGMYMGIFSACIIGAGAAAFFIMTKMYRRGMAASLENGGAAKKYGAPTEREFKSRSQVGALISRDFKNVLRNPALAVDSFLCVFMPAFIMMFLKFSIINGLGAGSSGGDADIVTAVINNELTGVGMVFLAAFAMGFPMNLTAGLAFTREGRTFYILMFLPLSAKDILKSKQVFADMVSYASIAFLLLTALASGLISYSAPLAALALVFFAKAFNALLIRRDAKQPRLDWNNIKEATGNNFGIMVTMWLSMLVGFALIVGAEVAASVAETMGDSVYNIIANTVFWAVITAAAVAVYIAVSVKGAEKTEALFRRIEENAVPAARMNSRRGNNRKNGFLS